MPELKKDIKMYLREVKKHLMCPWKMRKQILRSVESSIYDYTNEKNVQNVKDIYTHFGTPEEIAGTYLPATDIKKFKKTVIIQRIILAAAIVLFALLAAYLIVLLYASYDASLSYFKEDIIVYGSNEQYEELYSDIASSFETVIYQ